MSWEGGVLILLVALLVAGFAWYERLRPPSQIVALVAALAALAVAGRLVLAPIPNVVATTDIVLVSGYALGPAPGFVVGALAAVVSNFWLGQGPWTPWQMAGWGMCGVLGAVLAAATGRRLGRLPLAIACALAGLAYGALLDFSLMVTYGGEQSRDRFLAISARGVPFNVAHAAGNFVFALAAGPAMVRMLIRYRQRFEVQWRARPHLTPSAGGTRPAVFFLLVATSATLALAVGTADRDAEAARARGAGAALAWLSSAQNADGGFGTEPGSTSNPGMTGWAALGIEASGRHPADVRAGSISALAYLKRTGSMIRTTGDIERTMLVLGSAGRSARRFAGRNLLTALRNRRGSDGSWQGQVNLTAFGILALSAAGAASGNSASAAWLRGAQNEDGGWGFAANTASDPDSTGAVLQALAAAGASGDSAQRGVDYLRRQQQPGGGFALRGGPVNAQSTAWAVQGLLAAGIDPEQVRSGGQSPLDYLASVQAPDGHYRYSSSSDQTPVWVTAQALAAVNRQPFPLDRVRRRSRGREAGGDSAGAGAGPGIVGAPRDGPDPPSGGGDTDPGPAPAPATTPEPVAPTPLASHDEEDEEGSDLPVIAGGAALLGAGVWGGWLLYRRRLP